MSIIKSDSQFVLICDNCGEILPDKFDSFHEAVDAKQDNGWKSKKRHGNWEDWCPECAEED